jgi:hypothetical protein
MNAFNQTTGQSKSKTRHG